MDKLDLLLRIARRNIWRHSRRSMISIASIGFGLAVILWLQAILAGSNRNVLDTVTSTDHGDFQVLRKDYVEDRLIERTFQPGPWLDETIAVPSGLVATARVDVPALASSGERSVPVLLRGIEPAREALVTRVRASLVEGEFLDEADDHGCDTRAAYVGRALAKRLNLRLGNKFVILAQAVDGTLGNELLRIKGLFDTGSPDYDKALVFTTRSCAAEIVNLTGVHEIAFASIDRRRNLDATLAEVRARLPAGLTALSWRDVDPRLAAIEKFNDASLLLVSGILFVVISLGILNAFLISVFERTKEFGVMMALGASPRFVVELVMTEGLLLGVAASLFGVIGGALAIAYHAHRGFDLSVLVGPNFSVGIFKLNLIIYPVVDARAGLRATLLTLLVVNLAALYPALRAARFRPLAAMRDA